MRTRLRSSPGIQRAVCLLALGLFAFGQCRLLRAEEFTEEQFRAVDGVLEQGLTVLQKCSDEHIDMVRDALASATAESGHSRFEQGRQVLERISSDADKVKKTISEAREKIAARREQARDPGTMVALLARVQSADFAFYRWLRTAVEMTDLAYAAKGQEDPVAARFHGDLIGVHEELQRTLSTTIEGIGMRLVKE